MTLAWMDKNKEILQERTGQTDAEFQKSKVLVAATEWPMNNTVDTERGP